MEKVEKRLLYVLTRRTEHLESKHLIEEKYFIHLLQVTASYLTQQTEVH